MFYPNVSSFLCKMSLNTWKKALQIITRLLVLILNFPVSSSCAVWFLLSVTFAAWCFYFCALLVVSCVAAIFTSCLPDCSWRTWNPSDQFLGLRLLECCFIAISSVFPCGFALWWFFVFPVVYTLWIWVYSLWILGFWLFSKAVDPR